MNFKQKLGYMFIGCLFTIAGYILASLGGQTTHAQQSGQVIDEIVCRKLKVIHPTGKEVVSIFPIENGGGIIVNNTKGKRLAVIGVVKDGSGSIAVAGNTGKSGANITGDKYGGGMGFYSKDGREVITIGVTEKGNGAIQTYKGGWRTH